MPGNAPGSLGAASRTAAHGSDAEGERTPLLQDIRDSVSQEEERLGQYIDRAGKQAKLGR